MDTEKRRQELIQALGDDPAIQPLITEAVYLEGELDRLRPLPKLRVHPTDPSKQKPTPAARLYREFLQQYVNIIRTLIRATGADEHEEDSPLRAWFRQHEEVGA